MRENMPVFCLAAQPLWAIVYLIISWVVYCNG